MNIQHSARDAKRAWFAKLLICLFLLLYPRCNESLPSRTDPQQFFRGEVEFEYLYSPEENDFQFRVVLTNTFDETLQDTVFATGKLEITLARDLRRTRTVVLGQHNIQPSLAYDSLTNIVTIDPGESLVLRYVWDLVDDNGISLVDSVFTYHPDPACIQRMKSTNETFLVKGFVQITKHTGQILFGPKAITVSYLTPWVRPKDCTSQ